MDNPSSKAPNRAIAWLKTSLQAKVSFPVLIFKSGHSVLQRAQSDAQEAILLPQECNPILRASDNFGQIRQLNPEICRGLKICAFRHRSLAHEPTAGGRKDCPMCCS